MKLPALNQQREQTEQATMVVLCSNQAALRNRRDVLSLSLTRLDARRLGREAADAEDSPLVMTSCSAPSRNSIVI
jgi:hypothetical protein